jgi:hypothetical protein
VDQKKIREGKKKKRSDRQWVLPYWDSSTWALGVCVYQRFSREEEGKKKRRNKEKRRRKKKERRREEKWRKKRQRAEEE